MVTQGAIDDDWVAEPTTRTLRRGEPSNSASSKVTITHSCCVAADDLQLVAGDFLHDDIASTQYAMTRRLEIESRITSSTEHKTSAIVVSETKPRCGRSQSLARIAKTHATGSAVPAKGRVTNGFA